MSEGAEGTTGTVEAPAWLGEAGLDAAEHGFDEKALGQLARYENLPSALKGGIEARQSLSRAIPLHGDDATDEQKAETTAKINEHLGVPDSADKYVLDKPADLPDGVEWSEDFAKAAKATAAEAGLTQTQLDKMVKTQVAQTIAQQAAFAESQKADIESKKALAEKQEADAAKTRAEMIAQMGQTKFDKFFGEAGKAYDLADEVVPGLKAYFDESGQKNHPMIVKLMGFVFKQKIEEDTAPSSDASPGAAVPGSHFDYKSMDEPS